MEDCIRRRCAMCSEFEDEPKFICTSMLLVESCGHELILDMHGVRRMFKVSFPF